MSSFSQEFRLTDVVLGEVTPRVSKETKKEFKIAKFLGLGFTVESMNEELIKDVNFGDRGDLIFTLEPRASGAYIEMKAVFKRFEVTRRQGAPANGVKAAAPAPRTAAV